MLFIYDRNIKNIRTETVTANEISNKKLIISCYAKLNFSMYTLTNII